MAILLLSYLWIQIADMLNIDPVQPEYLYDKNEIMWFDASNEVFVLCLGDGTIVCRDVQTGGLLSRFKLKDYRYGSNDHVELVLSGSQHPRLACIDEVPLIRCDEDESDETGKLVDVVTFYDVRQGKVVGSSRERQYEVAMVSGKRFSEDGKYFTYQVGEVPNYQVAVDVEKSKTEWRLPTDKYRQVQMWPELGLFTSIESIKVTAYDRSKKEVWKREFSPSVKSLEWSCIQPKGSYMIIEGERNILCLSSKDGKTIWQAVREKGMILTAVASAGKPQAFRQSGHFWFAFLPDSQKVIVKEINEKDEGVFARNGKEYLSLPELTEIKENKKANTVTIARKSQILRIFDTETGKLLRQFDLAKMKD